MRKPWMIFTSLAKKKEYTPNNQKGKQSSQTVSLRGK